MVVIELMKITEEYQALKLSLRIEAYEQGEPYPLLLRLWNSAPLAPLACPRSYSLACFSIGVIFPFWIRVVNAAQIPKPANKPIIH